MFSDLAVRGSVAKTVGDNEILSIDTDVFSKAFKVVELRSMSRQSVILRYFARELAKTHRIGEADRHSLGIYVLSNDGDSHSSLLKKALYANEGDAGLLRSVSPKFITGMPSSQCITQISLEMECGGQSLCLYPSVSASEELVYEVQVDRELGRIRSAMVGLVFSASDPLESLPKQPGVVSEIGYLAYLKNVSEQHLRVLKERLFEQIQMMGVLYEPAGF